MLSIKDHSSSLHCQAPVEVTTVLKGGASWASGEFWSARRRELPSRA